MEQSQPFRPQIPGQKADARDIATRPVEAGNEAEVDRVYSVCKDNRNC